MEGAGEGILPTGRATGGAVGASGTTLIPPITVVMPGGRLGWGLEGGGGWREEGAGGTQGGVGRGVVV